MRAQRSSRPRDDLTETEVLTMALREWAGDQEAAARRARHRARDARTDFVIGSLRGEADRLDAWAATARAHADTLET